MDAPVFDAAKMERFLQEDLFAKVLFDGLKGGTKTSRLETVSNRVFQGNSLMTKSDERA